MKHKQFNTLFLFLVLGIVGYAKPLPKINLNISVVDRDTFNHGTLQLIDDKDTTNLNILVRQHGASSVHYDKKSYAIKLVDTLDQNIDAELLSMREDNYWILDAMAADKARMRNRVSMDLWLEFSRKPWYSSMEPKVINGYRGKMVNVFLNDSNAGIYTLMERVDRKQLKLKKFKQNANDTIVRGTLYKNTSYTLLSFYWIDYRNPMPDTGYVWNGWEQKYPDAEDGEPMNWHPLDHHVRFCGMTYGQTYKDSIEEHIDLPVYTDWVLLCQIMCGEDNVGKNAYLSFYDTISHRAVYTPWDMDHSWGRKYDGTELDASTSINFNKIGLYSRLRAYYGFEDTLKTRYKELRETYFTANHLMQLFDYYFDLYTETGMDSIEEQIWSGHNGIDLDFQSERELIRIWIDNRLHVTDSIYNYTQPIVPTGIQNSTTSSICTKKISRNGRLYIRRDDQYWDVLGRKIFIPEEVTTMP